MNLKEKMDEYKQQLEVIPKEEKVLDTIRKSKEVFYQREQEKVLTYWEFLWTQFRLVKKRWWLLQIILLVSIGILLPSIQEEHYMQRCLGVTGVLFVILVIPELWKNRTYYCMEIEASSYYSLRQIYATRVLLFGIVDVLFLTIFCGMMHGSLHFAFAELVVQFLFPMVITACICFGLLCNKYSYSEATSIMLCIIWSAVWWLITVNEKIYTVIVLPIWLGLFGIAILFLSVVIYKTLHDCNKCWEANFDGIKND